MAVADTLAARTYPYTLFRESWDPSHLLISADAYTDGEFSKTWYGNPKGVTADYPYEFCCQRIYTYVDETKSNDKDWEYWDVQNIALWSHYALNASFYTLTLDNPNDLVFYPEKNPTGEITLNPNGCTTSYIRLVRGTKTLETLDIDKLKVGDIDFIDDLGKISTELQTITLSQLNWTISLLAEQDSEGIKLTMMSGTITPNLDASGNISNTIVRIPITVTNNDDGVTKVVIWTVSALWDRYVHRYRIIPTPNNYNKYQTITKYVDNTTNPHDMVANTSEVKLYVFLDEENNAWHTILGYSYIVLIESLSGGVVLSTASNNTGYCTLYTTDLETLFAQTSYSSHAGSGWADGISFVVKLFVNDPNYSSTSAETASGYSDYYKVDLTTFTVSYSIVEILQGATGATGATGSSGDAGTIVTAKNNNDGTITLNIGSDSFIVLAATATTT